MRVYISSVLLLGLLNWNAQQRMGICFLVLLPVGHPDKRIDFVITFSLTFQGCRQVLLYRNCMPFGVNNELGDTNSIINSDGARSESNVELALSGNLSFRYSRDMRQERRKGGGSCSRRRGRRSPPPPAAFGPSEVWGNGGSPTGVVD